MVKRSDFNNAKDGHEDNDKNWDINYVWKYTARNICKRDDDRSDENGGDSNDYGDGD